MDIERKKRPSQSVSVEQNVPPASTSRRPSVRTAESLGKMSYETKPNVSNLIAGVVIAVLLIGGGLALSGFMIRQMFLPGGARPQDAGDWLGAALLTLMGIALAGGGVGLFLWVKSMVGSRVRVCADGFCSKRKGVDTVFAWDEILEVRETILHQKLPLMKGAARRLMPTKTSRNYTVVRCDGEEFYFDENVIPRTSLLAGPLSGAARKHNFGWTKTELNG